MNEVHVQTTNIGIPERGATGVGIGTPEVPEGHLDPAVTAGVPEERRARPMHRSIHCRVKQPHEVVQPAEGVRGARGERVTGADGPLAAPGPGTVSGDNGGWWAACRYCSRN